MEGVLCKLKFDKQGLIPAIVVDHKQGDVLMLGYMSRESLEKTLAEGYTCFWSRSRQKLWTKGETSGHKQKVLEIVADAITTHCSYELNRWEAQLATQASALLSQSNYG